MELTSRAWSRAGKPHASWHSTRVNPIGERSVGLGAAWCAGRRLDLLENERQASIVPSLFQNDPGRVKCKARYCDRNANANASCASCIELEEAENLSRLSTIFSSRWSAWHPVTRERKKENETVLAQSRDSRDEAARDDSGVGYRR
jgi:hypothetical protein